MNGENCFGKAAGSGWTRTGKTKAAVREGVDRANVHWRPQGGGGVIRTVAAPIKFVSYSYPNNQLCPMTRWKPPIRPVTEATGHN